MHGVAGVGLNAGQRCQRDGGLCVIIVLVQQFNAE
jgi:hypothetical protein